MMESIPGLGERSDSACLNAEGVRISKWMSWGDRGAIEREMESRERRGCSHAARATEGDGGELDVLGAVAEGDVVTLNRISKRFVQGAESIKRRDRSVRVVVVNSREVANVDFGNRIVLAVSSSHVMVVVVKGDGQAGGSR
ncbi:hypothetical protein AGABI2DRAFT_181712 [Agaricus bisporus var. bisporus H97]|uniref:hypothetical protein n=1 Tax=Agaricus bisporus var. bisporus (strain H97 / ATCC MYA-4626 / FGSC 10389) TaxID=936046 RepID=UPI00029F73C6|nr:hypothetical protein AGABI2DRAFT_181712 [Agaricus bisporus var. bisporus H97]EKV41932.1 hypothetical protein AGABI2DRAFT_181712 [Agaricus bisporus var. bisporus H97]